MQAFLLDTHVWLWLVFDEGRVSDHAHKNLEEAAKRNALGLSQASIWEVAVKARKGKLDLPPDTRTWLTRATRMPGLGVMELDRDVLIRSAELEMPVRDPADRMIVATALRYDLTLATADRKVLDFAVRHPQLRVFDVTG
jgi:PIN domain nuclease of toxin-antitoxin system